MRKPQEGYYTVRVATSLEYVFPLEYIREKLGLALARGYSGDRAFTTQPRPVFFSRIKTRDAPPGQTQKKPPCTDWGSLLRVL